SQGAEPKTPAGSKRSQVKPGQADVSAPDGVRRLIDAAKRRDSAAVAKLLKQGLEVRTPQFDGSTALHWAVHWDDLKIAEQLIGAGAPVNVANQFGVTPLWLASENGSAPMIERLVRAGANPNTVLSSGETPLMIASRVGAEAGVRALLLAGA